MCPRPVTLEIANSVSRQTAMAGETFTHTIHVMNTSSGRASGVTTYYDVRPGLAYLTSSPREAGVRFGITPGTVKTHLTSEAERLQHALKALRAIERH